MYYVGVDIGGTEIKAGLVSEKAEIILKKSISTPKNADYTILAKSIAELVYTIISDVTMAEVKSIGIGSPGSVDSKRGIVTYANNINLMNAPLLKEIRKYIDKEIYIDNDASCAALGEYFALNDDSVKDFIVVTLGTGVGSGIIMDGKIFSGHNGAAGELGHMVLFSGGEQCTCGRRGCWEAYASANALIRDTRRASKANPDSLLNKLIELNGGNVSGKIPWDALDAGDKTAKEVTDKYIFYVAEGIVNVINSFRPQVVAIGGGVSNQGERLLKPIREIVNKYSYGSEFIKPPKIVIAKYGNDAGILGAAFLGR